MASLKVAIPLLVLLTGATIIGSLFPEPELFRSPWYLGLLGLQGLSLLFITIIHIPSILHRKGRNALLGVITTHLGILVLIAGVIYGGSTGFRHKIRLVEGEMTVIPGLPFVIHLDELKVEEYRPEDFPRMNLQALPKKRQDSHITLYRQGTPWLTAVAAPGQPVKVDDVTLLPSVSGIGWSFELHVVDPGGRDNVIPVRPWAPPLIVLGQTRIMAHMIQSGEQLQAELFTLDGEQMTPIGVLTPDQPMNIEGYELAMGPVNRYTEMHIYNRPQGPVLVLGSILMFAGLVWHFYFRHRDRKKERRTDNA